MSSLASSSKLNSNGKRLAPPSPSVGANASSTKADGAAATKRQKRDIVGSIRDRVSPTPTPAAAAAAARATDFGSHMMTQLVYVVDFLKAKRAPKSLQEILDHLTMQNLPENQLQLFVGLMLNHSRIKHTPDPKNAKGPKNPNAWRMGTWQFRAKIPGVHDKVTLLTYLQAKTDASSLAVKDLKDGWPDCDQAITELEAEHKILVVRTKKDNNAKHIWLDDPRLSHAVDPEFLAMWHKIELPAPDDMVRKLVALGQKPASEAPQVNIKAPTKASKKRKSTRPPKHQSNAHMSHLLKDYSGQRR